MAKIFGAIVIATLISAANCANTNVCVQKSSCLCAFSEYSKIDISEVIKEKNPKKNAVFLADFSNGYTYYFHGCTDAYFNTTDYKVNSTEKYTTSLIRYNGTILEPIGNSSQIKFSPADDNTAYELTYTNGTSVFATVRLICDNFNVPFIKVVDTDSNKLVLSSPHACVKTHHPGLSTGSVLVIILFVVFGVYFVGGVAILYFIRGARGLELVPNIDFWRKIPGLVKDGVIFLFTGCNPTAISTPDSYDRI